MPLYISPYAFILLRVGIGMIFFRSYLFYWSDSRIKHKKDYVQLFVAAFFGIAFNMTAFFKGLSLTSSINASVLMLLAPVFVVIFSAIGSKTRIKPMVYVGILLAFLGAALLVDVFNFSLNNNGLWGDVLVMLNATSYAFYLYYVKRLLKKYNPLVINAFLFTFGFFMVLPLGVNGLAEVPWFSLPTKAIFSMAYVVIGVTILAYLLNAWALQHSDATTVGSYIYLQPLLATLIASALKMDQLSWWKAGCSLFILLGLFLINRSRP